MEDEDECSDSDTNATVGTTGGATGGVSGAGQSNLSTEVAALIQSELMRPRLRIGGAGSSNASSEGGRRRRRQPRRSGDAGPSNAGAPAAAAAGEAVAAPGRNEIFTCYKLLPFIKQRNIQIYYYI